MLRQIQLADQVKDLLYQRLDHNLWLGQAYWDSHRRCGRKQMKRSHVRVEADGMRQDNAVGDAVWNVNRPAEYVA